MAEVGDIRLRAVELAYPRGGSYDAGDDAELRMAVVNSGQQDDTLVEISGDGFRDVEVDAGTTSTGGTSSGTTSTGTAGGTSSASELEVPAGEAVHVDGETVTVTLTDLDESLTTGQPLELTFTFENAGEVTVPVTVSTPEEDLPRGETFDFHHEEGGAE
jgi:copper(I)-binding protein